MSIQELKTIHPKGELERIKLLVKITMSVQNPQLAGYLLTGNRSNFLYAESSNSWLIEYPQFLWALCEPDKCIDLTPLYHENTVMYIDPTKTQTFNDATLYLVTTI